MKRAVVRTLTVFAVATMVIAPAGAAHAAGAAYCVVRGHIDFGALLSDNGRDSTYEFGGSLDCPGTIDINGVWNTSASGNTTGILAGGETCTHGKSKGNGSVSATSAGRSLAGTMRFNRVGSIMQVGGNLTSNAGRYYLFTGVLLFTPLVAVCASQGSGVTGGSLFGVAEVVTAD